jgi:hypothetical protein
MPTQTKLSFTYMSRRLKEMQGYYDFHVYVNIIFNVCLFKYLLLLKQILCSYTNYNEIIKLFS